MTLHKVGFRPKKQFGQNYSFQYPMRSLTRPHYMGYERQQAATLTKLWGKIEFAPKLRGKSGFSPII